MAKRLLMIMLCVGALGAASLVVPQSAEARGRYYAPRHYAPAPVYRGNYYRGSYYAPRSVYYGPRYYTPRYYGGGGVYLNGPRTGIYIGW